ncbi:hypothetical protein [Pengzhenrongella sicca]|uniref:Secreted protein n=1 Tax=Pengzhenrongella sicca TaxID=2819238 RepID=A0A8A4ZDM3_9MICO|nr:hypothetical protein [Pengzhenrongella sicca]QTE30014.1 hypothetical protein J4E96_03025 [Pengzhenrongella sicca]
MTRKRAGGRVLCLVASVALVAGATASSASAKPDDGGFPDRHIVQRHACQLERVGTQLVRCDDLTGAGSRAPSHIPVQH